MSFSRLSPSNGCNTSCSFPVFDSALPSSQNSTSTSVRHLDNKKTLRSSSSACLTIFVLLIFLSRYKFSLSSLDRFLENSGPSLFNVTRIDNLLIIYICSRSLVFQIAGIALNTLGDRVCETSLMQLHSSMLIWNLFPPYSMALVSM